ncbi:MAG: phosphatase PAP2 family protein [Alphaproteobacteria bacterium]|jgi:undecaprenyl-diphosphatase|nr:phosphatase PAP2 family protein [Alphaproteobacteria bacterium]
MTLLLPFDLQHILLHITNLGDSGFLGMLSVCGAVYLYTVGAHRAALFLLFSLVASAGSIALLKIGFLGCHHVIPYLNIESPSGHAALSVAIYGCLTAIMMSHFTGWRRWGALIVYLLGVSAISLSRLYVGFHTGPEVLLGAALGAVIAGICFWGLRKPSPIHFKARHLALICLAPLLFLYGVHAPSEMLIRRLVAFLKDVMPYCP